MLHSFFFAGGLLSLGGSSVLSVRFVCGHHGIGVGVFGSVFGREIHVEGGARAGQMRSSLAGGVVVVVGVAAALVVCWLAGVGHLV